MATIAKLIFYELVLRDMGGLQSVVREKLGEQIAEKKASGTLVSIVK